MSIWIYIIYQGSLVIIAAQTDFSDVNASDIVILAAN